MANFICHLSYSLAVVVVVKSALLRDECRQVVLKNRIQNKTLRSHTIANETVNSQETCVILCYTEPRCVSTNFNLKQGVSPNCELNSEDDDKCPQDLIDAQDVIYQAIVNECNKQTCPVTNMTCLAGYGSHGYQCVCPKCFAGNSCHIANSVLTFPVQSIENTIILVQPFATSLTEFTIAMWIQADPTNVNELTTFGYATTGQPNEIKISIFSGKIEILMQDKTCGLFSYALAYDKWHHVALTWENVHGKGRLYIDGAQTDSCTLLAGTSIGTGTLVVGQDQDSYKGDFQRSQSFRGNMTSFNIWDKKLEAIEIENLAKSRPSEEGNIVKWSDLIPLRSSNIGIFCP